MNAPNSSSTPRPTRPRGDARRRQILDVAITLFGAKGFNTVGIAEIATEVGITQAGVLHHFHTKADLLLAVLQERENRVLLEQQRSEQLMGDYVSAFVHVLEDNEKAPALVQLFAVLSAESISTSHPGHAWFVERYEDAIARATTMLEKQIDKSKLPPGVTVEIIARWIHGMADGLRIQWLLDPTALNRYETVAQFVQLLEPFYYKTEAGAAGETES